MTKNSLAAAGLLSVLALGACSDASAPANGGAGAAGSSAGAAPAAGASGSGAAGAPAGGTGGGGQAGAGVSGAGAPAGGSAGVSASGAGGASGMSGSAGVAGASGGTGCTYKLCEGFEGLAPGAQGSDFAIDVDKKNSVVETVANKAHRGTHAAHVKVSAVAGVFGYITESKSLAATGASFWGRVFLWSEIPVAAGQHAVHIAVDGKSGTLNEQVRIVNVINAHLATNRRSDDATKGSNVTPPTGKWACYEWHITPNELHVFLEGTEVPVAETWTEPTLSLLRIGFERFTAGSAGDLWIDDIAINDTQVGCAN